MSQDSVVCGTRKIAYQFIVDESVNGTLSFAVEVAGDATASQIAVELAVLNEAAWSAIASASRRKLLLHSTRSEVRLRKIEEAKKTKIKLDQSEIDAEDANIAAVLVSLESETEALETVQRQMEKEMGE